MFLCNPTKNVKFLRLSESGEFLRSRSEIEEGVKLPDERKSKNSSVWLAKSFWASFPKKTQEIINKSLTPLNA